jgi:O-antigen/teichoic acid export membrane protein
MNEIRRAALFASLDKYAGLAINLVSVIVVSRLLKPDEIGLVAIGVAILALGEVIRDVVSGYLIGKPKIEHHDIGCAFTVTLILTLALSVSLAVLAGPAAAFAQDQRLSGLFLLLAIGVLPAPFERPLMALMRRDMRFGQVAAISICSTVCSSVVMIATAVAGWGAASYGWSVISGAGIAAVGVLLARPEHVWPQLTLTGWREIAVFARYANVAAILTQLNEMLVSVTLARFLSVSTLGTYNRANTIAQIPTKTILSAISPIVLPTLARQARDGGNLAQMLQLMIVLFTGAQWPALVMLALLAHPIVALLLGPQWNHAVPLVPIIALATIPQVFGAMCYPLLIAAGGVRHVLLAVVYFVPVSIVLTLVAATQGLYAFVWMLVAINLVHALVHLRAVQRYVSISAAEIACASAKSLPGIAGAAGGVLIAAWLFRGDLELTVLQGLVSGVAGLCGWAAVLKLTGHPLWYEIRHVADSLVRAFTQVKATPRP